MENQENQFIDGADNGPSVEDVAASFADLISDDMTISQNAEVDTSKTSPVEETAKTKDTTETTDTDQDVDEDYLAEVDEDEVDDPEEASEEETDEEDADEEEEYTFKADGEEVTVTLSELQKGFGLQKNLTRRGQEIAEKEKALEEKEKTLSYLSVNRELLPEIAKIESMSIEIDKAEEAVALGYVERDGKRVALSEENLANTEKKLRGAKAQLNLAKKELSEKQANIKPPKLDVLQKTIPEFFGNDKAKASEIVGAFENIADDLGFTRIEMAGLGNDPRFLLLLNEAKSGRELAARVEQAKARKGKKPASVVNKSTSAIKTTTVAGKKSTSAKRSKSTNNIDALAEKANKGDVSAYHDMFSEFVE